MKEVRFFYAPDASSSIELPEEEATHAIRVLRLQPGDEIMLMDGCGTYYRAEVTLATGKKCMYRIVETMPQERQWKGKLHIGIAPTKMIDRIEWMLEKATEIGLDGITFLNCRFSERRVVKTPRLDKIAISATKQSHKAWKPEVNEMVSFEQFVKQPFSGLKFIAHCYEEVDRTYLYDELQQANGDEDVIVLIGPEGDFSIDEVHMAVEAGFKSIHLGKSRLRTETAGLSALMMMQLTRIQ